MAKPDRALLLTPGASAGRDQPALVAVEKALAPVAVERMDFPYRKAGRKSPDKAPVLIEAVREGAAALAKRTRLTPDRLVLGGRSMGGRMCSMAVVDGLPALGPRSEERRGGKLGRARRWTFTRVLKRHSIR